MLPLVRIMMPIYYKQLLIANNNEQTFLFFSFLGIAYIAL